VHVPVFCPSCHVKLKTHDSRANWHPHLHLLVTDGGFRPGETFVSWPVHGTARLREAFRRAVSRLFVRLDLFEHAQASGMLSWPHSGFHVHTAVWVSEDDRAFATRLAQYCAWNPVALKRLTYDRAATTVQYCSDKSKGPTAGTETVDPLEFLAPSKWSESLKDQGVKDQGVRNLEALGQRLSSPTAWCKAWRSPIR